ncbi:MAG: N-acetyltransferase [Gammaproteobacteria bacterium]|nr:N-acetyltransferase [Gammaproteobacteria bacterium]
MNSAVQNFFVHESAYVDDGVEIGEGSSIWHFSHIIHGTRIGERCNIGQNVVIGGNVKIGNGCKIQNNVSVYEGVELEDDVFCGPSMVFTNVFTPRSHVSRKNEYLPTPVRQGATIGANATIVCGNEIGAFAFIGAGAVVTKPVPAQALMVGNPAKQIGWMCRCGERLPASHHCDRCGTDYQIDVTKKAIKEV